MGMVVALVRSDISRVASSVKPGNSIDLGQVVQEPPEGNSFGGGRWGVYISIDHAHG